jgi:MFS family permease
MKSFHPRLVLAVLSAGALMQPLDFFIVNLALPAIRDGLGTSSSVVQLILSAYASACAACMVTGGRLGDLFGRKLQVTAAAAAGCLFVCLVLCLYLVRRQGAIAKMQERVEAEVASES